MLTNEDKQWITETISHGIAASEERTAARIIVAKDETIEAMRDIQTEMLRGFETFSRGNAARMVRMETSDALMNTRLNALEERVLYLETRRPPA
jgi:hypothetical protein